MDKSTTEENSSFANTFHFESDGSILVQGEGSAADSWLRERRRTRARQGIMGVTILIKEHH